MITFKQMAPSILTLGSLFCGLLAGVFLMGSNPNLIVASWLILTAALFDALDGKVSRLLKTSSKFGVELDSIADVCSFGFAPGLLAYQYISASFSSSVAIPIAFLFLACGALRLARFNVELTGFDKSVFKGMPIPTAAGILASFVIFFESNASWFNRYSSSAEPVFPFFAVGLALLMVSSVKYDTFPRFSWEDRRNRVKLIVMLIWAAAAAVFHAEAFLPMGLFYLVTGFVRTAMDLGRRNSSVAAEEPAGSSESGRL